MMDRIRNPDKKDPCPCGTGYTFEKCSRADPHTPDELEYAWLVRKHYSDVKRRGIPKQVALRMLELEKLLNIETLLNIRYPVTSF